MPLAGGIHIGYEKIYLIGLLTQLYLDNNQPEYANIFFKFGMKIIHGKNNTAYKEHWDFINQIDSGLLNYDYMEEINSFLDLKIEIDKK
ncbi:hypothetical protein KKG82_00315, partial [Patescibacteria group bacterium]|nr:hypothetical protein [Patescibacteria group bacterium]